MEDNLKKLLEAETEVNSKVQEALKRKYVSPISTIILTLY